MFSLSFSSHLPAVILFVLLFHYLAEICQRAPVTRFILAQLVAVFYALLIWDETSLLDLKLSDHWCSGWHRCLDIQVSFHSVTILQFCWGISSGACRASSGGQPWISPWMPPFSQEPIRSLTCFLEGNFWFYFSLCHMINCPDSCQDTPYIF